MLNEMQDLRTKSQKMAPEQEIDWRRLPLAAVLAALGAAAINAGIYFAASGFGFISQSLPIPTPGGEQPLTVAPVVTGSILGAVGAAIVFALIGLFARRPARLFRIVATVALAISLVDPLMISGASVAMILSLMSMHVVAWAVSIGLLTTLTQRSHEAQGAA